MTSTFVLIFFSFFCCYKFNIAIAVISLEIFYLLFDLLCEQIMKKWIMVLLHIIPYYALLVLNYQMYILCSLSLVLVIAYFHCVPARPRVLASHNLHKKQGDKSLVRKGKPVADVRSIYELASPLASILSPFKNP